MTSSPSKIPPAIVLAALLIALALGTACHKKQVEITPDLSSSDEALYKLGEQYLKKDTEKAVLYLRQVIDSFPKSFYAQRAKLLIADAYFKKGDETNMILAAAEYREFIRTYPYSPSAAYSQYQIAMTFYKKMLKPGRDEKDRAKAEGLGPLLRGRLATLIPEASAGRVRTSRTEGGVVLEGRVVDCRHIGQAARFWGGMMSGSSTATWDLKLSDAKTGELLLAVHHRTTSSTAMSTLDSRVESWCASFAKLLAQRAVP